MFRIEASMANLMVTRWHTPPPPPGRHLLIEGPVRDVYDFAHQCVLVDIIKHRALLVIDCGLRFDPYALSTPAKLIGADPKDVLTQVSIVRPFTAYQLIAALTAVADAASPKGVVVLGLLDLWRSGEMKPRQAQEAMHGVSAALRETRRRGVSCLCFDSALSDVGGMARPVVKSMTARYALTSAR